MPQIALANAQFLPGGRMLKRKYPFVYIVSFENTFTQYCVAAQGWLVRFKYELAFVPAGPVLPKSQLMLAPPQAVYTSMPTALFAPLQSRLSVNISKLVMLAGFVKV